VNLLDEAAAIPAAFRDRLREMLDRALDFAERVAADPALEANAREAASGLYHIASAVLMTAEAARPGADARRVLYARLVLEHRLSAQDPLVPGERAWERAATEILLSERSVTLNEIEGLLT
jgi:acyl-CoA dehydrogenase